MKFTTLFFNERLGSRCALEVCPGVAVGRSTSQACQASRLLPSVANVRRRGRQSNDCPVLDGGGSLEVLSTQSGMRSNSGVLCNGCLAKTGPEQSSDTAAHQSRCHSLFVRRVVSECWCLGYMHSPGRGHRAFIVTRGANHAVSSPLKSSTAARLLAVLTLPFSSMNPHKYAKV